MSVVDLGAEDGYARHEHGGALLVEAVAHLVHVGGGVDPVARDGGDAHALAAARVLIGVDELDEAAATLRQRRRLLTHHVEEEGHGRVGIDAADAPRARAANARLRVAHVLTLDAQRDARANSAAHFELTRTLEKMQKQKHLLSKIVLTFCHLIFLVDSQTLISSVLLNAMRKCSLRASLRKTR